MSEQARTTVPAGAPTIGFDIGGTNLRAAVVTPAGEIIDSRAVLTPATDVEMIDAIVGLVEALHADHPTVAAVGLAVAGFLDPECEIVRFAPHLPLVNYPLRAHLAERLDLPVRLEHDANSAAWGEYRFGAAQGAGTWVLFAVGTGIGAALMIDGRIYRGAYGTAPEFGHIQVVAGGRVCSCGKAGCLERYASGTALVETALELAATGVGAGGELHAALLADPAGVGGPRIVAAARAGDPLGVATLESFADWLGVGLSMVADLLDPELIVLAGGVSADSGLYLDRAGRKMGETIVGAGHRPLARLATADLGPQAGMIGVADLARH